MRKKWDSWARESRKFKFQYYHYKQVLRLKLSESVSDRASIPTKRKPVQIRELWKVVLVRKMAGHMVGKMQLVDNFLPSRAELENL